MGHQLHEFALVQVQESLVQSQVVPPQAALFVKQMYAVNRQQTRDTAGTLGAAVAQAFKKEAKEEQELDKPHTRPRNQYLARPSATTSTAEQLV